MFQHHDDPDIGVAVIDRFTYYNLEVLEKIDMQSKATIKDLVRVVPMGRPFIH